MQPAWDDTDMSHNRTGKIIQTILSWTFREALHIWLFFINPRIVFMSESLLTLLSRPWRDQGR